MSYICNKAGTHKKCFNCDSATLHDFPCSGCTVVPEAKSVEFKYKKESNNGRRDVFNLHIAYNYYEQWDRVSRLSKYIRSLRKEDDRDKMIFGVHFSNVKKDPELIIVNINEDKINYKEFFFMVVKELVG